MNENKEIEYKVFVYGTLMNNSTVSAVSKESVRVFDHEVILDGYLKMGLNIGPHEGSLVYGRVLIFSKEGKKGIDRYEGLGEMYQEIEVYPRGYKDPVIAYQLIGTIA